MCAVAIMFPVATRSVAVAGGDEDLMLGTIASILSGSVWGDHCSPLSDTTCATCTALCCLRRAVLPTLPALPAFVFQLPALPNPGTHCAQLCLHIAAPIELAGAVSQRASCCRSRIPCMHPILISTLIGGQPTLRVWRVQPTSMSLLLH